MEGAPPHPNNIPFDVKMKLKLIWKNILPLWGREKETWKSGLVPILHIFFLPRLGLNAQGSISCLDSDVH